MVLGLVYEIYKPIIYKACINALPYKEQALREGRREGWQTRGKKGEKERGRWDERKGWKEKKKRREEEGMEGFGPVETEDRPSWALGYLGKSIYSCQR